MTVESLGFVISFVFVYGLLAWFIIGSKGKWGIKALATFFMVILTFVNWTSIENMLGWATNDELPEKFEILWVHVKEPNKKKQESGGIFLMLRYVSEYERGFSLFDKKDTQEPRMFKMDYSEERHRMAMGVIGKIKKGIRVFGSGKEQGNGKGKKGEKGKGERGREYLIEQDPLFYELPPPVLPQKNK